MNTKIFLIISLVWMACVAILPGAIENELVLPIGTRMENPAPGQRALILPDGHRLVLNGPGSVSAGFTGCVVYDPAGKLVCRGTRIQFVNPSIEKVVALPAGVRLVAIGNELVWARQGAPVPPGSYLMIGGEVTWLPTKLVYLSAPERSLPIPPPVKPPVQPK